jgi:hypothetical protein
MGLITGCKSLFAKEQTQKEASSTNQIAKSFFTGMGLMTPYFPWQYYSTPSFCPIRHSLPT